VRLLCLSVALCAYGVGCLEEGAGPELTEGAFSPRLSYPEGPYGVEIGQVIAPLSFVTPDEQTFSLEELYQNSRARLLLITTSAEWCTACIKEQPKLQALYERYQSYGLSVLVSLFQDSNFEPATAELAARWRDKYELSFDVVADPANPSTFSPYYDVNLTPMVMLVDASTMEIVYLNQGFDEEGVTSLIEARLTGPLPRQEHPAGPYGVAVGDTIQALSFVSDDGEPYSLTTPYRDLSQRLLLVTTSAEWCTACIKEQPKLQALYERLRPRGLGVLVSLFQDSNFEPATVELAARWRDKYELSFDVVADPADPSTFSPYYDVSLTPMVMIIDLQDMTILYLTQGFDEETVVGQLEALLPE
jgi:thiol-disulfide isomerase/thioredoxin